MEFTYKFVNGENIKIVVSGEFEGVMMQMEKDLYNNHKETRRHQSFSEILDKADMLIYKSINIENLKYRHKL